MKQLLSILLTCFVAWQVQAQTNGSIVPNLKQLNLLIDSCDVKLRGAYSPLVGLSVSDHGENASSISDTYIQSILKAGGSPVVIPATTDGEVLRNIVANLDAVIITGGADINPLWYGEQPRQTLKEVDPTRDEFELKLIKLASDRNVPLFGICRGEQLINVAFGGTLYQDIPSQRESYIKHVQQLPRQFASHTISIDPKSALAEILGKTEVGVNSYHHQAVKDLAPIFKATAYAPDSIIEAYDAFPNKTIMAVQWHPEGMTKAGDTTMVKIFRYWMEKARVFHQAKEMHKRFASVDTHTDTPFWFKRPGFNIADREKNRVNLPKMEEGKLDGVFLAAFIGQGKRDDASLQQAVEKVNGLIEGIHQQAEKNKDLCGIAITADDLYRLKREGKKAFFIGIENGYGIGKDLSNIARFKKMGVNYITLCHSYDNDICDSSSKTKNEWNGLSPFGREVVAEMNRQGVMIDLSHASEKSFWDVIELSKAPIICSHSSAMAVCKHDRNLTDEQLKALAKNGGVAQVCLLDRYINSDYKNACLMDAIEHIDHMVKVAGIDHVGIGSDFDGGGGIIGCEADNDFIQITVKLIERGYSEEDIAKIWGGNLLRVMTEVQAAATAKSL